MPFVLFATIIAIVAAVFAMGIAILVPLLPFVVIGLCVWFLTRRSQAAIAVRG
jgi:hypothetical protein